MCRDKCLVVRVTLSQSVNGILLVCGFSRQLGTCTVTVTDWTAPPLPLLIACRLSALPDMGMAAAALALLVLLVAPTVHGAEMVIDFNCPTKNTVTLKPTKDLADYQDADTTYILEEGDYTVSYVSNTAPLCYIGTGNVVLTSTGPIAFQPQAPLGLKGLTLDGQLTGERGAEVLRSSTDLYAEDVVIKRFKKGALYVSNSFRNAFLKNVQFMYNKGGGNGGGAAISGAAIANIVMDQVRVGDAWQSASCV